MQTSISIVVVLLACWQLVEAQSISKKMQFSWQGNFGIVNGNMMNTPVHIYWIEEEKCRQLRPFEQSPKLGLAYGLGINVSFTRTNAIGLGMQTGNLNFEQQLINESSTVKETSKAVDVNNRYRGWYLFHQLKLLHGNIATFSICNGLMYEKLIFSEAGCLDYQLRKKGISYIGKVEVAFKFGKILEFLVSPNFRLALKEYNHSNYLIGKYLPKGAGVSAGWHIYIN